MVCQPARAEANLELLCSRVRKCRGISTGPVCGEQGSGSPYWSIRLLWLVLGQGRRNNVMAKGCAEPCQPLEPGVFNPFSHTQPYVGDSSGQCSQGCTDTCMLSPCPRIPHIACSYTDPFWPFSGQHSISRAYEVISNHPEALICSIVSPCPSRPSTSPYKTEVSCGSGVPRAQKLVAQK